MEKKNRLFTGSGASHRRQIYKGAGYTDDDFGKPHIGVANAWTEASPAHMHLRRLAECVKAGIWQAGGVPFEFGLFATCGNIAVGTENLKYELAIRDVLAASIEIMSKVHLFDGLVLLSSCDNIIPGQLMGACRVNLPSIMVTGGPMLAGKWRKGTVLAPDVNEAVFGKLPLKGISESDLLEMEEHSCPGPGACPVMGTANTMQILSEAMEGGLIAIVEDGDMIEIDIPARRLNVELSENEIQLRFKKWQPPASKTAKGFLALYEKMALPADRGAAMQNWS